MASEPLTTRKRRPTLWRLPLPAENTEAIKKSLVRHIQTSIGRDEYSASVRDRYHALCLTVREELIARWISTHQTYRQSNARRIYYISMEFLMGRVLRNALINLKLLEPYRQALQEMGLSLEVLEDEGPEPGLGNGGLGRLAACFLDSMATLGLAGYGYGLRYDYGIFRQAIRDGRQVEEPDDWLRLANPWEIPRPEYSVAVKFGGRVQVYTGEDGRLRHQRVDTQDVLAVPYDLPIPGYGNNTVNTLRLWSAHGTENFDLEDFNVGDYIGAVSHKVMAETITKVLYPNDAIYQGQELRLRQQYFLVAATLHDVIRRHLTTNETCDNLAEKAVCQLNDTHPALAVVELMRILIDDHGYRFERAWEITQRCLAYTNHTLLPEALETWPMELFQRLLPRHVTILNEINHNFLCQVREAKPSDPGLIGRVSIYQDGPEKRIRMANLAVVGSFSVNGVAAMHTDLLKTRVLSDFYQLYPEKFSNKTNGVTQRRWLLGCNPLLSQLISERIGEGWITDLEQLRQLDTLTADEDFLAALRKAKAINKRRVAQDIAQNFGLTINPESVYDIQIKRIHEYKRQLLNALHIIHLYLRLKRDPTVLKNPRTFIIAGKAAPSYSLAKLMIKLINDVARMVNSDPRVSSVMQVFFYPNYNVTVGELLFPAADVSEQISTAGYEASGTGNMKFALNGAVTLGTLDGANVEILEQVGKENIFIFGKTADQVRALREAGYAPANLYRDNEAIREVVDLLQGDYFNTGEPGLYRPLVDSLLSRDTYMLFADFESYRESHLAIDEAYSDRARWDRMVLANIARMGTFSSDRSITDYNTDIWKAEAHRIELG